MKGLNRLLNLLIACWAGLFLGYGLFDVWDYVRFPALYREMETPWYMSILFRGLMVMVLLVVLILLKTAVSRAVFRKEEKQRLREAEEARRTEQPPLPDLAGEPETK